MVWAIYLVGVSGSLSAFLSFMCVLGIVAVLVGALISSVISDEIDTGAGVLKSYLWLPLICGLVACIIPGRQVAYAMLAAEGIEQALSSERGGALADKSLDAIEKVLTDYLTETKESK